MLVSNFEMESTSPRLVPEETKADSGSSDTHHSTSDISTADNTTH